MDRKLCSFTIKADAATKEFSGYGSTFGGQPDSYGDVIARGAFSKTLAAWKAKGKLPKMLLQHGGGFAGNADDMVPIGQWVDMHEDSVGLFAKGRLFDVDTDRMKGVYAAMKAGEMDGLSIGFQTVAYNFDETTDIRTLTEVNLWELSVVLFPANATARITAVKSFGRRTADIDGQLARIKRNALLGQLDRLSANLDARTAAMSAAIKQQQQEQQAQQARGMWIHGCYPGQ